MALVFGFGILTFDSSSLISWTGLGLGLGLGFVRCGRLGEESDMLVGFSAVEMVCLIFLWNSVIVCVDSGQFEIYTVRSLLPLGCSASSLSLHLCLRLNHGISFNEAGA